MVTGGRIGHYDIREKIGAGGMGEVYLAEDTRLSRKAAVKVLNDELSKDADKLNRFIQEAKAASALNHPNIITVYEIGEAEGHNYIVTEFIQGATLRDRMNSGAISLNDALKIALQIAAALGAAHEAGIVHRDIKPENIIVRDDGLVKVLDFGLAKLTEQRAETLASDEPTRLQFNTQPGLVMGTVGYMSPEQARGRSIDARSDIFSLGIVMYELFTAKRPFEGEGHLDVISSILRDDPTTIRSLQPTLPRQLERIVDKALRKDRDHRYQHIKDLAIDLEDLRDEIKFEAKLNKSSDQMLPVPDTGPVAMRSTLTSAIRTTRRFTLLHAMIFVVAAAAVVGAVFYFRPAGGGRLPGSYKTNEVASWTSAPGELFSSSSFSPDGKMIAFASTKSGSKNIWITQTGSTEARQITNDSFSNVRPIWSPKGDEVAFFSERSSSSGVWRVPALGGTPKAVATITDASAALRRWAPSGKLYYQLSGDLHSIDTTTGTTERVTELKQGKVSWINISADERSVAFVIQEDAGWKLMTSDIAGQKPAEVARGEGNIEGVVWLSDKGRFYYDSPVDGVRQVFETTGGPGTRITAAETDVSVADAAPDGNSIILSSAKEESNLWRASASDGPDSPVVRDLNAKLWPAVSPDNQRVVFQSVKNLSQGNRLFESSLIVRPLKPGSENEPGITLAQAGFLPVWSPDGRLIAFQKKAGDRADIGVVNPDGGVERRLTSVTGTLGGYSVSPYNYMQAAAFSWSPDGSRIAYIAEQNDVANVWTVGRGGGEAVLSDNTDAGLSLYCPLWSADGKRVAYAFQRKGRDEQGRTVRGVRVFDTDAGSSATIYETYFNMRLVGWSSDDKGLIVTEAERPGSVPPETVVKRVTTAGNPGNDIARLKNVYFYNIFQSNDRKFLAYAARENAMDDIWVMPASGGAARKLTSNNDPGLYFSRLAWLPDSSGVIFGKQTRYSLLSLLTDLDR